MTNLSIRFSSMNLPSLKELALPVPVKELVKELSSLETQVYLIGGFIRDMLLKINSYDMDFVIADKDPVAFTSELAKKYDGNSFILDDETKTCRLVLNDQLCKYYTFDFTSVTKGALEADFERRDFTVNTLAINLKEQDVLIDKFSGLQDLKQKKIKSVRLENLSSDPLRYLRAFRCASSMNGEVDKEILIFISNNLNLFNGSVSKERVSHELWRLLEAHNSYKYIKQISEIGLLEKIFPVLTPMKKVTPNDYHHLWLYDHSIELINTFEENFYKVPIWVQEELSKPFGAQESPTKKAIVKLACLFHDIGKPECWKVTNIDGKEKHTFYGHDKVGVEIVKKISEEQKFSNSILETLSRLVRYHLRPFQLSQGNEPITERALYRFFREVGDDIPLLLMLAMADMFATLGPKISKDDLNSGEKLILFLFEEYKKHQTAHLEKVKKPKLLDGYEIMKITGLKGSPRLGEIIKELDEAIAIGEVKTKEEAQEWVTRRVKSP